MTTALVIAFILASMGHSWLIYHLTIIYTNSLKSLTESALVQMNAKTSSESVSAAIELKRMDAMVEDFKNSDKVRKPIEANRERIPNVIKTIDGQKFNLVTEFETKDLSYVDDENA